MTLAWCLSNIFQYNFVPSFLLTVFSALKSNLFSLKVFIYFTLHFLVTTHYQKLNDFFKEILIQSFQLLKINTATFQMLPINLFAPMFSSVMIDVRSHQNIFLTTLLWQKFFYYVFLMLKKMVLWSIFQAVDLIFHYIFIHHFIDGNPYKRLRYESSDFLKNNALHHL